MTRPLTHVIATSQRTTAQPTAGHHFRLMTWELVVDVLAQTHHADFTLARRMLKLHNLNLYFGPFARHFRHIIAILLDNFHIVVAFRQATVSARQLHITNLRAGGTVAGVTLVRLRLMMAFLCVRSTGLATIGRFGVALAALDCDLCGHASTFHNRLLSAGIAWTIVTQRRTFVLAACQSFTANLIAVRALDAALTIAAVFLATLDELALCLTRELFGACKILLDIATAAFFPHHFETTRAVALMTTFKTLVSAACERFQASRAAALTHESIAGGRSENLLATKARLIETEWTFAAVARVTFSFALVRLT